jgi:hypothetical protein
VVRMLVGAIFVVLLSLSGTANATQFFGWAGAPGPALATFTDVSWVAGNRTFSGYEFDPFEFSASATVFTATGAPGSSPMSATLLGLSFFDSSGTSIESDGLGGYFMTAVQTQPPAEVRSLIYDSSDLGNPRQIKGAGPTFSPWVNLAGINSTGTASGDEAETLGLVATPLGFSYYPNIAVPTRLTSVDSTGNLFGGFSQPTPGGVFAATVMTSGGATVLQESVEGSVEDLEGDYAVGSSDGYATYWRLFGGVYTPFYIRAGGIPLEGSLLAIDHSSGLIAGGYLDDGRAIVVDLATSRWFDVASKVPGIPLGTLLEIVGVSVKGTQLSLAANSIDLVGYDITAVVIPDGPFVPGPGWMTAPLLLLAGLLAVRRRRA